jgi:hypothetical protein
MPISKEQWKQMERFRKGETTGDVVLLPPRQDSEPPPDPKPASPKA